MRLFQAQLNRRMFFLAPDDNGGGGTPDPGKKPDEGTPPEPDSLEAFLKDKPEADRALLKKLFEKEAGGLKSALDKEREARDAAEKEKKRIEKERAKAAEDKLAQDKQFEDLAKQRETRIAEIEPQIETLTKALDAAKAEAKAATDKVAELVEQQMKVLKLDEAVTELLNGKSAVEKLDWIVKHAEKLGKSAGVLPVTPKGDTDAAKISDEEAKKLTARTW